MKRLNVNIPDDLWERLQESRVRISCPTCGHSVRKLNISRILTEALEARLASSEREPKQFVREDPRLAHSR